MDGRRFDSLTRRLAGARTRRAVVGALLAGASVAAIGDSASAGRATCRAMWASCTRNQQCCTGTCAIGRNYPRVLRNRCVCIPDCGGGKCNVADGCGNFCPGCDDGWVCNEVNTCEAACAGTSGPCWLTVEGEQVEMPAACNSQSWTRDGCTSNEDCETGQDYPIYLGNHPGNVQAICAAAFYYDGNRNLTHDGGRCYMKPPATGTCWS